MANMIKLGLITAFLLGIGSDIYADVSSDWAASSAIAQQAGANAQSAVTQWAQQEQSGGFPDIPHFSAAPPQENISPDQIGSEAANSASTDPNAISITNQFNSGAQFPINNNTPMVQIADNIQANAGDIIKGTYPGCSQSQQCNTTYQNETCEYSRSLTLNATNTLNVMFTQAPPQQNTITLTLTVPYLMKQYSSISAALNVNLTNGQFTATDSWTGGNWVQNNARIQLSSLLPVTCSALQSTLVSENVDNQYTQFGQNYNLPSCSNNSSFNFNFYIGECIGHPGCNYHSGPPTVFTYVLNTMETPPPVEHDSWTNSIANIPSFCQMTSQTCIDDANPKMIDGQSVTKPCWQFAQVYQCLAPVTNSCDAYANTCNPLSSTCTNQYMLNGVCLTYDETYSCPIQNCTSQLTCGLDNFCINGDCYKPNPSQNQNFGQDEAALAGVSDALSSALNDDGSMNAFTGTGSSCRKVIAGFINCCANSGWGKNAGLAKCNSEEQQLGEAKEQGRVHYIGDYCSRSVVGICLEHSEGYCVFDDLLAYDIQVQGRLGQLGIDFGSAETPNCRGLGVQDGELQKIDFSKIDFSNVAQQLQNQMQVPNGGETENNILKEIERMEQQFGGGDGR